MNDVTGMPQTAVVIGGSSELAVTLLRRLAGRRLESVVLLGRDRAGLEAAAATLEASGVARIKIVILDVTDTDRLDEVAQDVAADLPSIDLVLVAAGVLGTGNLDDLDANAVAAVVDATFTGPAAATLAFAHILRRQGSGRIVVFSSVAGVRVRKANFVYGAAKAGLDGFSQGLGDALAGSGVRVMIVRPGFVYTKMTAGRPSAPFAVEPQAVADAIVRGLETDATVVWVPAFLHLAFTVLRLLPSWLWRRIPS